MKLRDDTILNFIEGCWKAGIKNPLSFLLSKRPQVYDWLKGAFPRGILPTDIDGEVEINGYFLRFEFKSREALENGYIPKGQKQALTRLCETKRFTVFVIGIDENAEPSCIEIYKHNGTQTKLMKTDRNGIREKCKAWAEWAQGNGNK